MRTLLVGLIGGALVFTYFWYRGDVGAIDLPVVGELTPPAAAQTYDPMAALNALPPSLRAVRAEFAPAEPLVRLSSAPAGPQVQIYAGQLIAKPVASADTETADDAIEEGAVQPEAAPTRRATLSGATPSRAALSGETSRTRSLRSAQMISAPSRTRALTVANEIGVVERTVGGAMLINLDYDLIDESEAEAEASGPDDQVQMRLAPNVVSNLTAESGVAYRSLSISPASRARPLAFNAGERVRERASRRQARRINWTVGATCPDNVDSDMVRANPHIGVTCAIERLRESGEFEYVEANMIASHEMISRSATTIGVAPGPDDPLYAFQWNYRNQGDGEGQSAGGAGFEDFWTRKNEQGSRDIVVAVIDTGLDMAHPDIAGSPNIGVGVDMVSVPFYGNDGDGRDRDPSDPGDICDTSDPSAQDSFHGTHVAGTIGAVATNDGSGVAGGAWNVTIVPVRALGRCGGLQSDINEAILWAAGVQPAIIEGPSGAEVFDNPNPADIINLSLGFRAPDGCPRSTQDAIDQAVAAGAIVVAAAGNAGINVSGYGPSGCDNVVTVSAGDGVGSLAYYSNWGDGVDIMAPGGDLRVDLDGDGRPDGILSTKRASDCIDPVTGDDIGECRYSYENGTSMAAPHVSAAFALLKSAYPARSNDQLVSLVTDTARTPRTAGQCTGSCDETPGGSPISGQAGMCSRPCGSGLLDLSRAVDE